MDEFINLYVDYWKNLLKFDGREDRRKFWITFLIVVVIGTLLSVITKYLWVFGTIIRGIYFTLSAVPTLALFWRRMHDTGREGYWALVPILNLIFAAGDSDGPNKYGVGPQ